MEIGIFDSGRGGRLIAEGLRSYVPNAQFRLIDDAAHAPYGPRSTDEITRLVIAAIDPAIKSGITTMIIACNTATIAAISALRAHYPEVTFIGTEPMIKPAANVSTARHMTFLSTYYTAKSDRFRSLIDEYAADFTVDIPDTTEWASMVDQGQSDVIRLNEVARSVAVGSDTIVIACTHYLALIPRLARDFPQVTILEPTAALARQLLQVRPDLASPQSPSSDQDDSAA